MILYWHRWRTKYGLAYHLHTVPQTGLETSRLILSPSKDDGEIAFVHRLADYWRGTVHQRGNSPTHWLHTGSPLRTRRLIGEYIRRKAYAFILSPSKDGEDVEIMECSK